MDILVSNKDHVFSKTVLTALVNTKYETPGKHFLFNHDKIWTKIVHFGNGLPRWLFIVKNALFLQWRHHWQRRAFVKRSGLLAGRTIFVPFLTWFLNFYGFIQVTGFSFNQSKMSNKRKIRNTNISFLILLFQNFTFLKIEMVLKPIPLRRLIKFSKTRRQVSIDLKA